MKYYRIGWSDQYDPSFYGVFPELYTSKEEAEKARQWEKAHPDAFCNTHVWIEEIDTENIRDKFVPRMTEAEYNDMISKCYDPQDDNETYDEEYEAYLAEQAADYSPEDSEVLPE